MQQPSTNSPTIPSTTFPSNNDEFEAMLQEISALDQQLQSAKTNLKKQYFKKKLDKSKQKFYKAMFRKALADPSVLKKQEEPNE